MEIIIIQTQKYKTGFSLYFSAMNRSSPRRRTLSQRYQQQEAVMRKNPYHQRNLTRGK